MILAFMCSFECVIAYISTFHLSCLRLMFRCFSVLPSFMRLCILLGLARFEFVLFCGKFFIDYVCTVRIMVVMSFLRKASVTKLT